MIDIGDSVIFNPFSDEDRYWGVRKSGLTEGKTYIVTKTDGSSCTLRNHQGGDSYWVTKQSLTSTRMSNEERIAARKKQLEVL